MAIGDNLNDLEMLEYAGRAVVMANASDEIRARPGAEVGSLPPRMMRTVLPWPSKRYCARHSDARYRR